MSDTTADLAWVAIGSNVGHRGRNLQRLRDALQRDGVCIERASTEIVTRPFGVAAQGDFHNQLLVLRSPARWSPRQWLQHCKDAEIAAGRRYTYRWGPRIADADIVLLGEQGDIASHEPDLVVPHPGLRDRPYLQRLLRELKPSAL